MIESKTCLRCSAAVPENARYCPACGVSLALAATGEHATYDFERFFQYAVDLLCIAGVNGFFLVVNPAFSRALGYSAKELVSRPFVDFVHPDDRDATVAETGELADGSPTLSFSNRYRRKDGRYVWLHWTAYPEPGTGLIYASARLGRLVGGDGG